VQGGVNKKITKADFFTTNIGDVLVIGNANGNILFGGSSNLVVEVASGGQIGLNWNGTQKLLIDTSGNITIDSQSGNTLTLRCNNAELAMDAGGGIDLFCDAAATLDMSYHPLTAGNWVAPEPDSVWEALDRIAEVVSLSGASPIP